MNYAMFSIVFALALIWIYRMQLFIQVRINNDETDKQLINKPLFLFIR